MEIAIFVGVIEAEIEIFPRLIIIIRRLRDAFLGFSEIIAILRRAVIEVNINYFRGAEAISIS